MAEAARFNMPKVPTPRDPNDTSFLRVINDNFRQLQNLLERAVVDGGLITDGAIGEDELSAAAKTLAGDVTGTIGSAGATTVADVSLLTTRGDLLYRNATQAARLAIGAANRILSTDGNDPTWSTLTALLDSIGSTRGSILYKGAAGWAILAPNTAGYVLTDSGVGADPAWAAAAGGTPPTDFDLLTDGVSSLIFAGGDVVWIT